MTTRKVIDKVGLFDERFFKHEDLDFTLRLSSGNVLKAIPEYIGIHHTIPYHNSQRLKKNFAQYHTLFGRLFIKDAFLNPQGVMMILLENWGFFGGILFYFAICISAKYYSLKLTLAVFIFIISADIFYGIFHKKNIPYRLYCHYLTPVFMLWGILKPQKNKFFTFVKVDY
jgi:GT2 family glycosyltransferase